MIALRHAKEICPCGEFMGPSRLVAGKRLLDAAKFATVDEAKAFRDRAHFPRNYDVVEITWGLRWYVDGKPWENAPYPYITDSPWLGKQTRKSARRYATPKEARAERDALGGKWRVVRFTKIVSKGA